MTVGYVQQKEMKKGEEVRRWFEMSIRVPFGTCTLTMTKRKPKDGDAENAPDFDLFFSPNRKGETFDRMKVGSLWMKISEKQNKYLSGYIESPFITNGKMYISVVSYIHQEGMPVQPILYNVLWSAPQTSGQNSNYQPDDNQRGSSDTQQTTSANIPEIDINEDEIPF